MKRSEPTPLVWRYGAERATRTYVLAPFAGGSAYAMGDWPRRLLRGNESALVLQYPGRGPRAAEPPATSLSALAAEAAEAVLKHSTGPVVPVGHSLGGVLAHTLALRLEDAGRPVELLVASAARPPASVRLDAGQVLAMTDAQWLAELTRFSSYDPRLLEDPDVLDLIVPVLRADYLMLARHVPENRRVSCPVVAVGGADDTWVGAGHLAAWGRWTAAGLTTRTLPGGHFYYRDGLTALTGLIHDALDGVHGRKVYR
ncbi:thioesterase II family protein [Streptomyces sp. NPDC014733]|uniref:thioesterase II family protein n=1 Tax=Streptomyces sp. NPDC014733 TaxID=3364885 RepID=UPI0037012319